MFWIAGCSLLSAAGFFCSLGVLYRGLGMGKIAIFYQKNINFFLSFKFLVIKTLDPELDPDTDPQLEKMLDPDPYPGPH